MNEMKKKAQFYFENKITIHIDTKDKQFYNGLIIEISETSLIINDRVLGEVYVSFYEIESLEKFRGRGME